MAFKNRLDDYCNGDLEKALAIIDIATVHGYIDCQWAINLFEKEIINQLGSINPQSAVRVTEQKKKKTTIVGDEEF